MISSISLASDAGSVTFNDFDEADNGVVLKVGLAGFGLVQPKVRIDESAGVGGVLRQSRKGIRDIDFPITITGTPTYVAATVTLIGRILSTPASLLVTMDDSFFPVNDVSSRTFSLTVVHVGGGDAQFGSESGSQFCNWVLQLQAPKPFWTRLVDRVIQVQSGVPRNGFIRNLTKLPVTSSQLFGTVEIDNSESSVECPVVWELHGPISSASILNSAGRGFEFLETIPAGETVFVDTDARTVVNAEGENLYGLLAPAPCFFGLPPGYSTVQVQGFDAETTSRVLCRYKPHVEVLV